MCEAMPSCSSAESRMGDLRGLGGLDARRLLPTTQPLHPFQQYHCLTKHTDLHAVHAICSHDHGHIVARSPTPPALTQSYTQTGTRARVWLWMLPHMHASLHAPQHHKNHAPEHLAGGWAGARVATHALLNDLSHLRRALAGHIGRHNAAANGQLARHDLPQDHSQTAHPPGMPAISGGLFSSGSPCLGR